MLIQPKARYYKLTLFGFVALLSSTLGACATSKKTTPELSRLKGKRVALVEVKAESTARNIVEVALVNQLASRGTFEIIPKKEIERVRAKATIDPTDWKRIASEAGADYAMKAQVERFDADIREGFITKKEYDESLAEERGKDDAIAENVYRVKSLDGNIAIRISFTNLKTGEERSALAEASKRIETQDHKKKSVPKLPPRMSFLETLSNEAFKKFFDDYQ